MNKISQNNLAAHINSGYFLKELKTALINIYPTAFNLRCWCDAAELLMLKFRIAVKNISGTKTTEVSRLRYANFITKLLICKLTFAKPVSLCCYCAKLH